MKKGYKVTIFEKQRYAAMETSFANGGQLSACNGESGRTGRQFFKALNDFQKMLLCI